MGVSEKNM